MRVYTYTCYTGCSELAYEITDDAQKRKTSNIHFDSPKSRTKNVITSALQIRIGAKFKF